MYSRVGTVILFSQKLFSCVTGLCMAQFDLRGSNFGQAMEICSNAAKEDILYCQDDFDAGNNDEEDGGGGDNGPDDDNSTNNNITTVNPGKSI